MRPFFGEPYKVVFQPNQPSWQVACPVFNREYDPRLEVVVESDAVWFDGEPAYNVEISELDKFGQVQLAFTVDRVFKLGGTDVPVHIDFSGGAGYEIVSIDGSVKFDAPALVGDCAMAHHVWGPFATDPETGGSR